MRIYLLYTYHEYGPENLRATLYPSNLINIIKNWPKESVYNSDRTEAISSLENLGEIKDLPVTSEKDEIIYRLEDGWGGLTLHIVESE